MVLEEYPFDHQLLTLSRLYRDSRKFYLGLGATFTRKVSSTMRSLSAHDLFSDEIEYTPSLTELVWFKNHYMEVADPEDEIRALMRFSDISIFHEQNHRLVWRLLPPASKNSHEIGRYLNFAESIVATLDIALADELGPEISVTLEKLKVIYRIGRAQRWAKHSRQTYRSYLEAFLCATYLLLEWIHKDDIAEAVDYILPGQKKMNGQAVRRAVELSDLFTRVTNPLWQERNLESAKAKLAKMHANSKEAPLRLPSDPLDIEDELLIARRALSFFGL